MNPKQEYLFNAALIGMVRGFADGLATQNAHLLPRATAFQHSADDLRATQSLRQIAADYGLSPDAAERRYWEYAEAGWREEEAFNEVLAELDRA